MWKSYILLYDSLYLLVAICFRVVLGGWPQILTWPIIRRIKKDNFSWFLIAKKLHTFICLAVFTGRYILKGSFRGLAPNSHPAYNSKHKKRSFFMIFNCEKVTYFYVLRYLLVAICSRVVLGGWPQIFTRPIIRTLKKDNFSWFLIVKKLHTFICSAVLTSCYMLKGNSRGSAPNFHRAYNSKNKKILITKMLHTFTCFAVFSENNTKG